MIIHPLLIIDVNHVDKCVFPRQGRRLTMLQNRWYSVSKLLRIAFINIRFVIHI